jgi:hypothetical protein
MLVKWTDNLKVSVRGSIVQNNATLLKLPIHWEGFPVRTEMRPQKHGSVRREGLQEQQY